MVVVEEEEEEEEEEAEEEEEEEEATAKACGVALPTPSLWVMRLLKEEWEETTAAVFDFFFPSAGEMFTAVLPEVLLLPSGDGANLNGEIFLRFAFGSALVEEDEFGFSCSRRFSVVDMMTVEWWNGVWSGSGRGRGRELGRQKGRENLAPTKGFCCRKHLRTISYLSV